MAKCLVTKLNGSVDNNELLRIGEMRIKVESVESPAIGVLGFDVAFTNPTTLEIVGDGYFTDSNLTENKGKSIVVSSLERVVVSQATTVAIRDKYKLLKLNVYNPGGIPYGKNKILNIEDLKYSTALTSLYLSDSKAYGDIVNLKNLTSLTSLDMSDAQVTGDIANLKNLSSLTYLNMYNTQVTGDIANLKNLTSLTSLSLTNKQVPLTGDIGQLRTLSNCTSIYLHYSKFTGDLAMIPSICRFVSFLNDKGSVFTWSTRPSTDKIIAIEGNARLTNIDKMLQDQAQCQVGFSSNDDSWLKVISVVGNRTSASDNAVATLQQKGYTISIENV